VLERIRRRLSNVAVVWRPALVGRCNSAPPNIRVPRARSLPAALRSPLTRRPSGTRAIREGKIVDRQALRFDPKGDRDFRTVPIVKNSGAPE
jgi:hypothetical protein